MWWGVRFQRVGTRGSRCWIRAGTGGFRCYPDRPFFSFGDLAGPSRHREYNEWHQRDHRPENLLLPGVAWGERWARPAGYKGLGDSCQDLSGTDYVATYWFRPPYEQRVAAWAKAGQGLQSGAAADLRSTPTIYRILHTGERLWGAGQVSADA